MIVLVFGFIVGAILGSFINSAVWRVYTKKFSCTDRSRCVTCLEVLSWYDNIPIFSFLRLRGGCRLCQEKIPFDYLLVEIITGFLGVFLVYVNGVHVSGISPLFFRDMVVVLCLVFIFVYDAKYMEILDRVTVLPAILLVIVSLIFGWQSLFVMGIGAIAGGGFFLIQYMVSRGRWDSYSAKSRINTKCCKDNIYNKVCAYGNNNTNNCINQNLCSFFVFFWTAK